MIKRYEVIREIFNKCSGNQMRDIFFEEAETDDPAAYVTKRFEGYHISQEPVSASGELVFEIEADGLRQRMTLTEI